MAFWWMTRSDLPSPSTAVLHTTGNTRPEKFSCFWSQDLKLKPFLKSTMRAYNMYPDTLEYSSAITEAMGHESVQDARADDLALFNACMRSVHLITP